MAEIEIDRRPFTEVFDLVVQIGIAARVAPLNGRIWVYDIDEHWKIALNGARHAVEAEPPGCMRTTISPHELAVWWHGWLAGSVGPLDGVLVAHPSGANEDRLIAAMRSKLDELREGS